MWLVYVIAAFVVYGLIAGLYDFIRTKVSGFYRDYETFKRQRADFFDEQRVWERVVNDDLHAVRTLAAEKSVGFPWLAAAYADYFQLRDLQRADELETKEHPAPRSAEVVREVAKRRATAEKLWRVCKYKLQYYESLFPWLVELQGEDVDDLIREVLNGPPEEDSPDAIDPAHQWLTDGEYATLSAAQKYQLALDRYWRSRKTRWQVGRDYERYIGYEIETAGYHVEYHGIVEGLADLGRDLVAKCGAETLIVQCKNWSSEKQIHEKHVFQLFGTVTAYKIDHPAENVRGLLVTSTVLSDMAKKFAEALGIGYREELKLGTYPCIKCNVSYRDGEKIYHLPFDQQYDRTQIDADRGERYVGTVADAEGLGFRRAFRWQGNVDVDGVSISIPD